MFPYWSDSREGGREGERAYLPIRELAGEAVDEPLVVVIVVREGGGFAPGRQSVRLVAEGGGE